MYEYHGITKTEIKHIEIFNCLASSKREKCKLHIIRELRYKREMFLLQ